MRFSSSLLFAALASLVCAQNPFTFTTTPVVTAGTPFNITWAPSTGTVDTVTLNLRQGDPQHLATVMTIAPSIKNIGYYIWTPPTSLVQANNYAFEIVDDGNAYINNYSGQFSISSTNTVSSTVPASTTAGSASVSQSSSNAASQTTGTKTTSTASSKTTGTETASGSSSGAASSGTSSGSSTESSTSATSTKNAASGLRAGGALVAVFGAVAAAL